MPTPASDPSETASSEALSRELLRAEQPTIDGYTVIEEIGRGSFGTVYACRSTEERRRVAIKVPRPQAEAIALFERELDLLLRLPDHRHVVRVLRGTRATFRHGSLPAVVMAWIPNARAIDEYCDHHRLGQRARVLLLARIAEGLQHLHDHGVVHLDLKPKNVLVADDGEPVIVDLGAARERLGSADGPSAMTIAYASPEQLEGTDPETLDQRSDIYSFGRLMGAVLLGRDATTLHAQASRSDATRAMRAWSIEAYRSHPGWPGGELGTLLEATLVTDRSDRVIRAHQVAERLNAIAQPRLTRLSSVARRLGRSPWLRDAAAFALTTCLGIALALGLCWAYAALDMGPRLTYPARTVGPLRDVVLVELKDAEAIARADEGRMPAGDALQKANRRRALFAKAIRQAAAGQASATVIDSMLPQTAALAEGTQALVEALAATRPTMPTVLGISVRWTMARDSSVVDPALEPLAFGFGSFDILPDSGAGLLIPVAILRDDARPALHLSAAAVAAHRHATVDVSPGGVPFGMPTIRFAAPWDRPSATCTLDGLLSVTVDDLNRTDGPLLSPEVRAGDRAALLALDVPSLTREGPSMGMPIDEFLRLDEVTLRTLVRGKIVLLWNGEDNADRPKITAAGEHAPGGWVQAAAIQALVDGRDHGPSDRTIASLVLVAAAGGSLFGAASIRVLLRRARLRGQLRSIVPGALVLVGSAAWLIAVGHAPDFRAALLLLAALLAAALAAITQYLRIALPDPPRLAR